MPIRPPTLPQSTPVQPTASSERIEALDVMRGLALLGIFLMNMPGFSSSAYTPEAISQAQSAMQSPWDQAAGLISAYALEGKFNGLFTLLFGLGLALQFTRLQDSTTANRVVARRLAVLLIFGVAHAVLLWGGDVLHIYAVIGGLLACVRHWRPAALMALAVTLLLAQFAHGVILAGLWTPEAFEAEQAFLARLHSLDEAVFGGGTWWDGAQLRADEFKLRYTERFLLEPQSWFWLALSCTAVLGLLVARLGALDADSPQARWLASRSGLRALLGLLGLGLLLRGVAAQLSEGFTPGQRPPPGLLWAWALEDTHRVLMVLAYAGLILRACRVSERPFALRRHFAAAGRMPLSLYLLQSGLGTLVFHGWGLGLWGQLGLAAQCGLALLLFMGIQVPLAHWWLARHELGPMEALWRRLSYANRLQTPGKAHIDRPDQDR